MASLEQRGNCYRVALRGGLTKSQVKELWGGLYLNPVEITEVLEHVRQRGLNSWLYPFIATAAYTGARRSELLRARGSMISISRTGS